MRPLVSVVCACFNISKYLHEAIASIYAQGYPNLELIVVDDGSTDDTYERLAMLRERHGFQLYRQANRGVSDALNHGLRHARGEFVMTPDLDDILLPGALDTRVDYLLAHPEVGCVGGSISVSTVLVTKWRETVSARGVWSVGGSMQHWPRPWWSCR